MAKLSREGPGGFHSRLRCVCVSSAPSMVVLLAGSARPLQEVPSSVVGIPLLCTPARGFFLGQTPAARVGFRASLFWLRDPGFLPASERAFDFEGPCRYFLRLPWPHAVLPAASHHASPLNRGLGQPEGKRQAGFWGPTADGRFFPSSASLSFVSNALRSQPGALLICVPKELEVNLGP